MDWPRNLRSCVFFALMSFVSPQTRAAERPMEPRSLDFQSVLQRVRQASLSVARMDQLQKSSEFSRAAVAQQSYPTLQWGETLGYQKSLGAKQLHAISLSATLWDFGRQAALDLKAQAQVELARAQWQENDDLLKLRTARYYVGLASAESIFALSLEQLRNAESKLQTVIAAYKRGERPETDVIKLKVELGKAQLFFNKSKEELAALTAQLYLATNSTAQNLPNQLVMRIQPLPERSEQQWATFFERWFASSIDSSVSSLARIAANKASLQAELKSLDADNTPLIAAGATLQGVGQLQPVKPDVLAQLNLQYALPLSATRANKRDALLARLKENELAYDEDMKTRRDKRLQTQVVTDGLLRTIDLQKRQISSLLEYQKMMRNRYFSGRASLLELTSTEDDLLANKLELTRLNASLYSAAIDAAESLGGKNLEALF